jgi:hypothetical protein
LNFCISISFRKLFSILLKYYLVHVVFCIFTCCPEYNCSIYGQQYGCVLYSFFFSICTTFDKLSSFPLQKCKRWSASAALVRH